MRRGRCQRKHHLSSRLRPHLLVPMRPVAVRQGTTHRCRPGRIKERRLWRVATPQVSARCLHCSRCRPALPISAVRPIRPHSLRRVESDRSPPPAAPPHLTLPMNRTTTHPRLASRQAMLFFAMRRCRAGASACSHTHIWPPCAATNAAAASVSVAIGT